MITLLALAVAAAATSPAPAIFLNEGGGMLVFETDGVGIHPEKVKAGTPYRRVDLKGVSKTYTTSADGRMSEQVCGAMGSLPDIPFAAIDELPAPSVLVSGTWKAAPDHVELVKPEAVDTATVTAYLQANGIAKPDVQIAQVVVADVDGDGSPDRIIVATHRPEEQDAMPVKGDYAVALLVSTKGGKSQTIKIAAELFDPKEEGAPYGNFILTAIADLDGDGTMEIVVEQPYVEGDGASAYGLDASGAYVVKAGVDCGA